jgi:site-specific DNA recombinase
MPNPNPAQSIAAEPTIRVCLYLRVSTQRQAEHDASIPSQRDACRQYCAAQGWHIVSEYVDAGHSATTDARPEFQAMVSAARSPEHPFDIILVHSFSRFFRDETLFEITRRDLDKKGVRIVSVSQPLGDDEAADLSRKVINLFDGYFSAQNSANVRRTMRQNAASGFWNGATPPLGYKTIDAEKRGQKIKKRIALEPTEAELVRLIYKLYLEGDGTTGPLGVNGITRWLNDRGYRTRKGALFGVGPTHNILKARYYVTGQWPHGVDRSNNRLTRPPMDPVHIPVPKIIDEEAFEAVQRTLAERNPRVTAPREVNGPSLLIGLAKCGHCGSSMTRTGTTRGKRRYSYYSCSGCQTKGKSACTGQHVRTDLLDTVVLNAIRNHVLDPLRLEALLRGLIDRHQQNQASVDQRMRDLKSTFEEARMKLSRLYKLVEDGDVAVDDELKTRIANVKAEKEKTEAAYDYVRRQAMPQGEINGELLDRFGRLMSEKLENADNNLRRNHITSLIDAVVVQGKKVQIHGRRQQLDAAVRSHVNGRVIVPGFVRKWRALRESNPSLQRERLSS